jgi:hydroxyacylglutathione hydrolase
MSTGPVVLPLVDQGLGNSAYLVDLGDGRGLAVDVSRDLRALRAAAAKGGLRVAYVAETHLHADFISGARQLSTTDGATVFASQSGAREFPCHGLADGDEVDLGGLRLSGVTTPGHTGEHMAYLLSDGGHPVGVFTGGSLLVGSAARTDLVSPEQTDSLAREQYRSIQRLLTLPDHVLVWPTHGAGSFCSAPPGDERTSTIGKERASNPLLLAGSEDAFVELLLSSLGTFPPYFLRLAEVNRRGPAVLGAPPNPPPLEPADAVRMLAGGANLVDVRPVADYAAGHVAGSLSIPLRDAFATWLGWLAPAGQPLVLLRDPAQDIEEVGWQAAKIGLAFAGELDGGISAARAAGLPIEATALLAPGETGDQQVIDVRQQSEFAAGHLPGAINVELGDLARAAAALDPSIPVVVMCGHGERALTGASLLARAGRRGASVLDGGPEEWAEAHGAALVYGS